MSEAGSAWWTPGKPTGRPPTARRSRCFTTSGAVKAANRRARRGVRPSQRGCGRVDSTPPRAPGDYVKPTFRMKCPSLRLRTPPPAQWTMNASRMIARTATTIQKKNTTIPGTAYPATVLALATGRQLPAKIGVIRYSRRCQDCEALTVPLCAELRRPVNAPVRACETSSGGPAPRAQHDVADVVRSRGGSGRAKALFLHFYVPGR